MIFERAKHDSTTKHQRFFLVKLCSNEEARIEYPLNPLEIMAFNLRKGFNGLILGILPLSPIPIVLHLQSTPIHTETAQLIIELSSSSLINKKPYSI